MYAFMCTYVVLRKGRCDGSVAGLPFVGDTNCLRGFLLHRLRFVQERQLVKLLDVCNISKKYFVLFKLYNKS